MRKILLFLAALILISGFAFAQENVIPVKIVEFPLPSSARTYEISEYRSFVEMDRPFMGDGFSCRFAPFTSADISDYSYDTEGEAIVFKRVDNVEKTESIGTVFFTAKFQYIVCQDISFPAARRTRLQREMNSMSIPNGTDRT